MAAMGIKTPPTDEVLDKKPAIDSKNESGQKDASTQDASKTEIESDESNINEDIENDQNDQGEDELEDSEESGEQDDGQKGKKKNGFSKRIKKLTGKLSEKDREIEYWKSKAINSKETQDKPQSQVNTSENEDASKPKSENFETNEDYIEALTDWKIEQREKREALKLQQEKLKSEFKEKAETFQSRLTEFQKNTPDFSETIEDVDDIQISVHVQDAILTSDFGPALMYELAKNRDVYEKINGLPRDRAFLEIGKIEAKIQEKNSSTPTKQAKQTTKAPPPIKPVGTSGTGTSKNPEEMSFSEFKKWRESQKS